MLIKPVPPLSLIKYKQSTSPLVLYHMLSLIFQFAIIHKFMIPAPYHAAVTTLVFYCLNFVLSIQLEFKNQSTPLAVFLENFMFYFLFNLIKISVDVSCLVGTYFLPPKFFQLDVNSNFLCLAGTYFLPPKFFQLDVNSKFLCLVGTYFLPPKFLQLDVNSNFPCSMVLMKNRGK